MTDNDSIISSLGRSANITLNASRRLPADFPIRTGTLNGDRPLAAQIAELTGGMEEMAREVAHNTPARRQSSSDPLLLRPSALRARHLRDTNAGCAENNSMRELYIHHSRLPAIDTPPEQEPVQYKGLKKCVTTLTSALPKTLYEESNDSTERTLAYVMVQRAVLMYQNKRPSDTLSPRQARSWTQGIEPKNRMPVAKDALRLCYYMRSQGFDTYANFERSTVSLYVVDRYGEANGTRGEDAVYWRQNFLTNEITYLAPSLSGTHIGRRNAIVLGHTSQPRLMDLNEIFQGMRGSDSYTESPESVGSYGVDDEAEAEDMDTHQGLWDEFQGNHGATQAIYTESQQPTLEQGRTQLQLRLAQAQGALDAILSTETGSPDTIQAAIALVEEYQQRLDQR